MGRKSERKGEKANKRTGEEVVERPMVRESHICVRDVGVKKEAMDSAVPFSRLRKGKGTQERRGVWREIPRVRKESNGEEGRKASVHRGKVVTIVGRENRGGASKEEVFGVQ